MRIRAICGTYKETHLQITNMGERSNGTMDQLPQEILEYIFEDINLSFRDICRCACACKKFREASNNNKLWKRKFVERWPQLVKYCSSDPGCNWKEIFKIRHISGVILCRNISEMSSKYYRHDEMSKEAFTEFLELCDHPQGQYFIVDELEQILHDGNPNSNLTNKYYAQRVLRYMRHKYLEILWNEFLSQPASHQFMEKGSILLAQWCQPTQRISEEAIYTELNSITKRVSEEIMLRYPKHPVLKTGMLPADQSLEQSMWTPSECKSIFICLNIVLFHHLKFQGNKEDYYCAENSFINQVLEKKGGIPISLCVIYAAITRRFGVVCYPVNFPGHFLLKWIEHPGLVGGQEYTFIDVFDQGKFLTQGDCQDLVPGYQPTSDNWYSVAEPVQVFRRMCWNLVEVGRQQEGMGDGLMCLCNALELLTILNPEDVEHRLLLARVYLHLNINLTEVMSLLQEISARDPSSTGIIAYMYQAAQSQMAAQRVRHQTRKVAIKPRTVNPNVQFAVGMIMTHKKYNYTCVIYGWDAVCAASRDWIYQMGVFNLPNKDKQPFYNVLVEDGSNRYAAQENLEVASEPKAIPHVEVGKYFQFFCNSFYVPNEEKEAEYPEDGTVRNSMLNNSVDSSRNELE